MTAGIFIVDPIATTRIRLRALLSSAGHDTAVADGPDGLLRAIAEKGADIVVLGPGLTISAAAQLAKTAKTTMKTGCLFLLLTDSFDPEMRLRALKAGFDDVECTPINDAGLRARIRNMLRARSLNQEAVERADAMDGLGLAEAPSTFGGARQALSVDGAGDDKLMARYQRQFDACVKLQRVDAAQFFVRLGERPGAPDLLILPSCGIGDHDGLATIAELRARAKTRQSALLFAYQPGERRVANSALDMGANDIICTDATPEELQIRITKLLDQKAKRDALSKMMDRGIQLAVSDPLTGVYNRRYALQYLARVQSRSAKTGRPFATMLLDLDWFKQVNDQFGHPAGDAVLIEVTTRLRNNLRAEDLLARIGGEEFLIVIPDTDAASARATAERLRRVVAGAPIAPANESARIRVTVSIGLSLSWPEDHANAPDIIKAADRALLIAKSQGRNTVETWGKAA